jgi:glycosyltransferase involved in cell wall biosynthesis
MRKLLIVDPTLVSLAGHSYNYDRAIIGAAREHFDEVVLYTGTGFRAPEGDALVYRPVLNRLPMERLKCSVNAVFHRFARRGDQGRPVDTAAAGHATVVPGVWRWMIHLAKFLRSRDLEASLRTVVAEHPTGELHVFLQHAHLHDLLAADRLRGAFAGRAAVHFYLLLRYSPEFVNAGYLDKDDFAALLERVTESAAPRVQLLTDSARLSAEYRALGVRKVVTVPVPIVLPEEAPPAGEPGILDVSFLGAARVEKGYCELPSLVGRLTRQAGGRRIRAVIQTTRDSADPRVRVATEELHALARKLPADTLRLLDSPVPMDVYYGWLRSAGIVALPYLSQKYNASTSGIFVEAICFGVPVLAPAHSWMSDIIGEARSSHGLHIGEVFTSLDEFPALVERMAAEIARYRTDARRYSSVWRRTHNPEACVRTLLAATAG